MILWTSRPDKISHQDYAEYCLLFDLIRDSFQKILIHYGNGKYKKCFQEFNIYFDKKNKITKKPEKYVNDLLFGYLETERSGREPFDAINGLHRKNHPFVKFDTATTHGNPASDLKAILKNGITFEDSRKYSGLLLADIVASSLRRMLLSKIDSDIFNLIRTNCAWYKTGRPVQYYSFKMNKVSSSKYDILKFFEISANKISNFKF
jgi:hypothetical protein